MRMNPKTIQPNPAGNSPIPPPAPPPGSPAPSQSPDALPKAKKNKKKTVIIILIVLLVAGLIGAWFIIRKPAPKQQPVPQKTQQPAKKTLAPYTIAYTKGDYAKAPVQLLWQPVAHTDPTVAGDLGVNAYMTYTQVMNNKVLVVTEPSNGGAEGTLIWYSKDGGKSYVKIFEGSKPDKARYYEHDQITSARFSSDGTTIVFGLLSSIATQGNTIKEINPETKAIKDLFVLDASGVFIQGYNRATHQLIYTTGCYNCDGNANRELLMRDTITAKETVLYGDKANNYGGIEINKAFTKLIYRKAERSDNIVPVDSSLVELTLKDKTTKKIADIDKNSSSASGYTDDDDQLYYSKNKDLYKIGTDGIAKLLLSSEQKFSSVYYLSTKQIIATIQAPPFTNGSFSLISYDVPKKSITSIFTDSGLNTNIIGVTLH